MEDGVGVKRTTDGVSWFVYYRIPRAPGSRATKTVQEYLINCGKITDARATLIARKAAVNAGNYKRQERSKEITLEQLANIFFVARRHLGTVDRYRDHFVNHVAPYFGSNTLVRAITREQIESFYASKLDEGCAIASCNYYLTTIRTMLALGFERGFMDDNPARRVKIKKANNRRERMLTNDEATALIGAAKKFDDYRRPFFLLLFNTGMRKTEALSLPWSDVDLVQGLVRLRKTKTDIGRWVPLAADVHAELVRWRTVIAGESYVFPGRRKADGTETHIKTIDKGWAKLCEAAGVKVGRHELRHNFVSQALANGHSPADIMPITGHTTMRSFEGYAHTLLARKRAVTESVLPPELRQRLPGDCPTENVDDGTAGDSSK